MTRKLTRRSLTPAAAPAAPAAPAAQAVPQQQAPQIISVTPAPAPAGDPAITVELLTSIPGIGKTVAERVVEIAPTVARIWGRWKTAGDFASEVKGLSAAGASKIWDKVRETWPHLASTPILGLATEEKEKPVATQPSVPTEPALPAPYSSFSPEQLTALLPTLFSPIKEQVQEFLSPSEREAIEEQVQESLSPSEPPPLPPQLAAFNPDQLQVLLPTLSEGDRALVEAYLQFAYSVEEEAVVADPVPPVVQQVPKQQAAPAPAPAPQPTQAHVGNLLSYFQRENKRYAGGGSSGKTPFVKMTSGRNVLRILGPYKSGASPFRVFKLHTYKQSGQTQWALDYNWLRTENDFARYLLSEGKIHEQDILAARELGDPLQELPLRLSQQDRKEEAKHLWARTRYLWNVIDRSTGELKVWESSKTFFDQVAQFDENGQLIGGLLYVYPDLFDHATGRDVQINGNGQEGKLRRYLPPIALEPSPTGLSDDMKLFDLDAVVSRKAKSWNEKAEALFQLSSRLAVSVGMTPNDWLGAADRYK